MAITNNCMYVVAISVFLCCFAVSLSPLSVFLATVKLNGHQLTVVYHQWLEYFDWLLEGETVEKVGERSQFGKPLCLQAERLFACPRF